MTIRTTTIATLVAIGLAAAACGGSGSSGLTGSRSSTGSTSASTATSSSGGAASSFAALERGVDNGEDNVCTRGEVACIDAILTEMGARLDKLAATCDHLAPWALTYLKTTEGFRTLVTTPGALHDPVFATRLDFRFAQLYFHAYDNWYGGHRNDVPQAWEIAFDAADTEAVSGLGNVMLGISAHISRDLPVALVKAGLAADGSSRLDDFRTINKVFESVISPAMADVAARFDPTITTSNIPGIAVDEQGVLAVIAGWRETSFVDGERLSAAGADGASVLAQIDSTTANESLAIRAATTYLPFVSGPQQRDDFCRQHGAG